MADAHALEQPLVGMARYEKGGVLGEGTFGVVCKAQDRLARPRPCPRGVALAEQPLTCTDPRGCCHQEESAGQVQRGACAQQSREAV